MVCDLTLLIALLQLFCSLRYSILRQLSPPPSLVVHVYACCKMLKCSSLLMLFVYFCDIFLVVPNVLVALSLFACSAHARAHTRNKYCPCKWAVDQFLYVHSRLASFVQMRGSIAPWLDDILNKQPYQVWCTGRAHACGCSSPSAQYPGTSPYIFDHYCSSLYKLKLSSLITMPRRDTQGQRI